MKRPDLVTCIDIRIGSNGMLQAVSVVRASAMGAFDAAAVAALWKSAPFAAPPLEVLDADGTAHLLWEFHSDDMACSNVNAFPLSGQHVQ